MSDPEVPPPAEGVAPSAYETKPPLWQPTEKPAGMSRLETGLTAGLGIVVVLMIGAYFEPQYFATPATAVPVQIVSVSNAIPAEKHQAARFTYQVRIPDGTTASFTTDRSHPAGTRLMAMVSRGRITGRAVVSSPYSVLPAE